MNIHESKNKILKISCNMTIHIVIIDFKVDMTQNRLPLSIT